MNRTRQAAGVAALAAVVALAGCASPAGIAPEARLAAPTVAQADAPTATVAPDWWRAFGDPQLDALIAQALEGHPDIGVARARLRRAQAASAAAQAATLPQVNGALDINRQRYTEKGMIPAPLAGSVEEDGLLRLATGWELDFFGRNEAVLRAALGATRAAQAELEAARLVLAANVARTWFSLARIKAQLAVAERMLAQREEQLRLVQQRVSVGLDTALELRQSEGALPEARLQIEMLREQAQAARNALAALVARADVPELEQVPALAAIRADATVPVLPADLLGRRPGVAAARWRVEAALQDVAHARTRFYPDVSLTAFVGLSSLGLHNLLDGASRQWGVGPAIRLPVFDAGRLRAQLAGKTADLDAAVESYNATLLAAVRDAADQVAALQSLARQQAAQHEAQAAAEAAYDIARQRYAAGLGTYLHVLAAESAVLQQRRQGVDLAARVLDARVGLYRALGGGYAADTAQLAAH